MKFKCIHSKHNTFTVGNIYEGNYASTSSCGEDWCEAWNNRGRRSLIILDGRWWK